MGDQQIADVLVRATNRNPVMVATMASAGFGHLTQNHYTVQKPKCHKLRTSTLYTTPGPDETFCAHRCRRSLCAMQAPLQPEAAHRWLTHATTAMSTMSLRKYGGRPVFEAQIA